MAASPGNDHTPDFFPAADAGLPFPLVNSMTLLEFPAISFRIHVVGNRGAAQTDRRRKNLADRAIKRCELFLRKI